MIHAVSAANVHLYAAQLDQMFRMRHAFYVEGRQWAHLRSDNGRERDEFDGEATVYLISLDETGGVAASVRLNPTTGPHLLAKFAHQCDAPPPRGPDIWDISRWIAAPAHRRGEAPRWSTNHQRELMIGILEFCLAHGIARLVMLSELRLAERIAAYGWPLRYLGQPREYEGGPRTKTGGVAVAAEIRIGEDVLSLTRAKTGVTGRTLVEAA
jgi:acyl-homoserine lactone synthase